MCSASAASQRIDWVAAQVSGSERTETSRPQVNQLQPSNYEAIFLMGFYSDKTELWLPGEQDSDKLKMYSFQILCTEIPTDDPKFLEAEFLKYP